MEKLEETGVVAHKYYDSGAGRGAVRRALHLGRPDHSLQTQEVRRLLLRNISRDFADGVLFAELVSNYFPKKVEVHNYPTASSSKAKLNNWTTLNAKVLTKLGMEIPE